MNQPVWRNIFRSLILTVFALGFVVGEVWGQCAVLPPILSLGSNKVPNGLCSPVTANLQYNISFSAPLPAGNTYRVHFEWNDGQLPAESFVLLASGSMVYNVNSNRVFPTNSDCEYQVRMIIRVNGAACASTIQFQRIASWRTDAFNGGNIQLVSPVSGTNIHEVCEGVATSVVFTDLSVFNCNSQYPVNYTPGGPFIETPNEQIRWQQIIYNTPNGPPRIPDTRVNGVPVTNTEPPGGDLILNYNDPRVSATENAFGVFRMAAPVVINDPRRRPTLTITAPGGFGVGFPDLGDEIEITIRYWNFCNPYANDFDLTPVGGNNQNGDNPPVEATAYIRIIDSPNAPSVNPSPPVFCQGQSNGSYNLTASGAGGTFRWYNNPALLPGNLVKTGNTFNPVTEGGVNKNPGSSTTTNYYVTEEGAATCVSAPTLVPFTIHINKTGGTIANPLGVSGTHICTGTDPPPFTNSASAGGGNGVVGDDIYQWQDSPNGVAWSDIVGANSATYDPPALAATTYFRRRVRESFYNLSGSCDEAFSNVYQFIIDVAVTGGSIGSNQTICATPGDPSNLTNTGSPTGGDGSFAYQWEESTVGVGGPYNTIGGATSTTYNPPAGVIATTYYRRRVTSGVCAGFNIAYSNVVTVTVDQVVVPGVVNNPQTICSGQDPAILGETTPPSGGDGVTYTFQWQESATGGGAGFAAAPGLNTNPTYDPPVLTATRFYRRRVTSGVCPATFSNEIQITVNPLPTAPNPTGGGAICAGNPAPDIVWTGLTGTPPFNITYTINGVPQPGPIVEPTTTFTIASPLVAGTYQISVLQDANGCFATVLGGTATVTVGGFPPIFDSGPSLSIVNACDDGGATLDPVLNFSLDFNSASLNNFTLRYTIDGSAVRIKNFNTDAAGDPIGLDAPITFTDAELNSVLPSPHVINIVSIVSQAGCQTIFNTPLNFTVQPRPPTATNPVNAVACIGGGGSPISVDDPQLVTPNTEIRWSTGGPALASFANADPGSGTAGGTNFNTFTPTNSTTATFYAFVVNTSTGCFSTTGIAVQHTEDQQPAAAVAGPAQPGLCAGTATMASTAATNGGSGTWTVLGQVAYQQNFENNTVFPIGTTTSAAANGWTIDTSDPNAFPQQTPGGFFEVRAGKRFEANNTNGNLGGGGGNIGEVAWFSQVIDISSLTSVDAFVDMFDVNGGLDNEDYYNVFYKLNGGGEVLFTTNGSEINDFPDQTASVTGLSGATLQIVIRIATTGGTETIAFDNVIVRQTGSTVSFNDPNAINAVVSNLPQNPPGGAPIAYTARWTVASGLGACPSSSDDVILTVNPLPTSVDPMPNLCEDVAGGGQTSGVDLTTYNAAVTNAPTVAWFSDAARTMVVVAPVIVNNTTNKIFYFRATSAVGCQNVGQITFTVDALPAAVDKNFEFCENTVGAGLAGNFAGNTIDLTSFEFGAGGVTNGGTAVTRDVEWYEDAGLTTLIPPGAGVGQEQNYTITLTKTIYAKVIDITSTVTPQCFDVADVTLTLKLRPTDNPITGSGTVCTSPTNVVLYQVNPTLNPGSTYTWNVSGTADFTVFGGGGVNSTNFFILLRFPGPTLGTVDIDVFETVNGCDGNTDNFVVTVSGAPGSITFNSPQTNVCTNQTGVVYSINAPNPLSLYTWTAPGATFPGASSGVGLSSVTIDFNTVTPVTVSVTETSSSGCAGSPASVVVNLVDRPVMTSSSTTTVCSGNAPPLVFTASLSGAPTTFVNFSWQVINITGGITGTTLGNVGAGNLSEILTNTSGISGTVTYRVTPTETAVPNPPNCTGNTQDVVVTVNPEPVLVTPQTKTICSGQVAGYEILLNPVTLPAGTIFNWPAPTMSAGPAQGTAGVNVAAGASGTIHINDVLTNTTNSAITATYTITPTSAGCPGTPRTVVITINPEPTVSTTLDATICSDIPTGLTLAVSGTSVAAANYNVTARTIGVGLTAAGGNAFVPASGVAANYLANDAFTNTSGAPIDVTYTVVGVSGAGCTGAPQVITITIDPKPVVSTTLDATICSDLPIGLMLATNGTSVAAASYNVNSIVIAPGLTAGGGNAAIPSSGVAANFLTGDTYTNTGSSPLTVAYTVVPVSAAGCLGNSKVITITIDPEPVISTILDASVCSDASIGLTLATNGASVAASIYNITNQTIAAGLTAGGTNAVVPAAGVASGYLAADKFTNTTAGSLTVTYTVEGVSASGCIGNPQIITITINPEPVVSTLLDITVCSDVATGLNLATNGTSIAAATYNITARTIQAGLTPGGSNALVTATGVAANYLANDTFTNTGSTQLTVTYTVVGVSASGCEGDPQVITITVDPEPVIATTLDATVCSDDAIALNLNTNGSSVAAANYNITARTISAGLVANGGNAVVPATGVAPNYLANDSYTNTGATPLTVTYTVAGVSAAGCLGNTRVITMIINPEPVVSTTLNTTVCSDVATGLVLNTNGTSVAALNYNVTSINVAPGLVAAGSNAVVPANGVATNYLASDKFTNTGTTPLTVIYTVEALSGANCLGDPQTITITINPEPVVSNTLDLTQCSNVPIGLVLNTNGTSEPASNYNITSITVSAGLTPNGGNVPVPATGVAANYLVNHTFSNITSLSLTVSYTVVPVSAAGCLGDSKIITVTIDSGPVVSTTLDGTVCSDAPIGLTLATDASSAPAASYNITARTISAGLTAGGANAVVPFNGGAANYLAADTYTNTGASPLTVTYTVIGVGATGCLGNPRVITMTINPEPVVATTLNTTVCSDVATGLNLNTNGVSVGALDYNVTGRSIAAGLTAAGTNVAVPATGVGSNYLANDKFTNTGAVPLDVTYTVVARSAAGCLGDPQVITITISPEPVVSNTLNATLCSDLTIGLVLNTNGTSVAAANYNVNSITISAGLAAAAGNAIVPASGVGVNYLANDIFTNTGNLPLTVVYNIVPVSASGCLGDSKSVTITIDPEPVVSTTLDASVCSDISTGLTLNTNGVSVAAATYDITARSIAAGLVAAGGNAAVPAFGVVSNYLAGDSFTNTTGGSLAVTYTVVPVSAAGCIGNSQIITITINPEPVISSTLDATVCSDASTGLVLNTNGTSAIAASYNVTASTVAAGLVPAGANAVVPFNGVPANYLSADQFTNTGSVPLNVTYTVVGVSGSACSGDPQVVTITINPEPVVSNTLDLTQCSDVGIGLVLNTNGTSVAAANYNITARTVAPGLTIGASNAVITATGVAANYLAADQYTNVGSVPLVVTYTVVPVSAAGCLGDSKVITVTIDPEPVVSTTLDATVCSDLPIALTLNTNGSSVAAATYDITARSISAGLIAGGGNAVAPAAGVADNYLAGDVFTNPTASPLTVTYTVVGVSAAGCVGDSRVITMTINPEPVISATLDATVCSDLATALTLNTDGVSIAAFNYDVTNRTIAAGLVAAGTNAAVPAVGVAANYLAADKFTNTGAVPLDVTYTVFATSGAGCLGDSRVITITIAPEPVMSNTLDLTQCSDVATGLVLNTNGASVAAATYNITAISISAGLTAFGGNAVVPTNGVAANYLAGDMFTNTGGVSRTVTYTVIPVSASGCLGDSKVVTVTVDPEPVVSTGLDATICSDVLIGLTLNTNGTSVAAANYNITSQTISAGLTAGGGNAVVPATGVAANYLSADVYTNLTSAPLTVTYTVRGVSASGCIGDTRVITITINPEPIVATTLNATVCSDVATGLTLNTSGASVAAASYNVTTINVSAGLTAAGTNAFIPGNGVVAGYLAGDKFTNPTAAPLTVDYTVVGISGNGCLGDPQIITITIAPEPVVSSTLNLTQCSDNAIGLVLNTDGVSVAAANYNITARTIAAGLTASGSNAVITANGVAANYLASDQYTNPGAIPLAVTYTVVPVSAAGCVGDPKVITVTINPEPVVSSTLNSTVCSDLNTGLTLATNGTSVAAANYNITAQSISAGLTASGGNVAVPAIGVSNNYLANDSFTNPTNGALTVTYTVVPVSAAGCLGDARVITVTINPEPVVSSSLDATSCSDSSIGLVLTTNGSSVAAANYDITARTIDPSLIAAGTNVVVPAVGVAANYLASDRFTNTGAVPLLVTYTAFPTSAAGCKGDPIVITITIDPEPVVANGLDATVCSDVAIGLTLNTNGTSVAAANYNITSRTISAGLVANGGNGIVPATGVAANYLAGDIFTNTTSSALTVTYSVVPVSASGCQGDTKVITFTINPEPVIVNGLDAIRCSDIATGLTLSTTGTSAVAANYNITNITMAAGLIAAGTNAVIPATGAAPNYLANDRFTNPGVVPLTVVYTAVPVTAAGCLGDPKTITITINAEPVGADDTKTICSDDAVTYDLQNNVNMLGNGFASNFLWVAAPNGSVTGESTIAKSSPIITDVLNNVTNADQVIVYTVTPTGTNGCVGNNFTVTVTVRPEPVGSDDVATINSDIILNYDLQNNVNTIGNNLPANFTWVASINSNVGGESTSVQSGPIITDVLNNVTSNNQTVTYTVVPTGTNGCLGNPFIITVTVLPEPVGVNDAITVNSDVMLSYDLQNNINSVGNGVPSTFSWVATPNASVTGESTTPQAVGMLNDIINNVTGVDQVVVYTVTPTGTNGVLGDPFIITVTVRSEPVGSNDAVTVCSDIAVAYDLQNNINTPPGNGQASTFSWFAANNPSVTGESTTPQSGAFITNTLNNVTNMDQLVSYTVIPTGTNGAVGNSFQIDVTVQPEPVMDPALAATTICSTTVSNTNPIGVVLNTNGTSIGALNYNVTLKSQDVGLIGAPTVGPGLASTAIQNDTYDNTTTVPLTVVYTIVPVSPVGCLGDPFDITVNVNPEPVVNPALDNTVCSKDIAGIILSTNGTSVNADFYRLVNVTVPGTITANGGNAPVGTVSGINLIRNDVYTNTTAGPAIVTYEIRGISPSGCEGESEFIDLTVSPEPIMGPGTANLCSDVPSGIIVGPTVGSVVTTQFELKAIAKAGPLVAGGSNAGLGIYAANLAGGQADFLANDVFTNTTAGPLVVTYTIVPIASGCRGADQTVVFTVNPSPAIATNLNKVVCTDDISGIILATTGSSAPVASYNIDNVVIQAGLTQTAGNTGARVGVAATEIQNDRFQNPGNTPLTVTYTVRGVTAATCIGPARDITLTIEPTITAVPVNNSATICSSTQTDIDLTSPTLPTAGNITFNYTVTAPAGVTGFIPSLSFLPLGHKITDNLVNNNNNAVTVTYSITAVASGAKSGAGCIGTPVDVMVNVEPKPKLVASPLMQTVCESDGVNASPTSILLTSTTVPSVGTLEFNQISAVVTGGLTLISPLKTTYLNGESITDQWDNPTLTDQTVTYTLRPVVNGGLGCPGDDVIITVTIKPRPIITPVAPQAVCSGEFRSIPLVTDIPGTFATWTVTAPGTITGALNGGGNSLDITLFNSGFNVETVTYTVTPKFNNCNGTPTDIVITVNPTPNTTGLPATITVCDGATLNVPITSSVPGTTWNWVVTDVFNLEAPGFFDGTGTTINQVINNPNGFQAVLIYQVTPTTPAGCVGLPKIMNVNVGSIVANVTPDQTSICSGRRIQMTNSSLGATSHRWFYRVQGTTTEIDVRTTPFVNYQLDNTTTTNPLVYEIVYQPSNGLCTVPDVVTPITVYRNVVAGFDEGTVPPIVGGTATVNFTNTSNPNDGSQFRYEWDFGSSTFANPPTFVGATPPPVVYSQQGPYQITVKAVNIAAETAGLMCESSFFKTIVIPVLPLVADFTLDPPAGCFPTTVRVSENLSTGDIMEWKVVDSNGKVVAVSGQDLPEFFIPTPGLFNVQLTTRDSFTDQVEFANANFEIYDVPIASFQARPTTVFIPDTELTTFNFSTGADFYQWDFGDGETSDEREPKHIYKIEGVYDIVMIAGFDHGNGVLCTDTLSQQVVAKQGGQTKVPNAFTPNPAGPSGGLSGGGSGSGGAGSFNDVFLPIVKGVEEFNMQIFDRWGNLIFESNSANQGWDGYDRNGNILPSGVYVYKLTLRLSDGQRTTQIGDITMIR